MPLKKRSDASRRGEDATSSALPCGNCGSRGNEEEGIRCVGPCRGWFHFGCLSLTDEEVAEAREDGASRPWSCDRCLALSLAVQELLNTVKILNERLHSLETDNQDLTRRLELLESHDSTPEHTSAKSATSDMDTGTGSIADETTSAHEATKDDGNGSCKATKKVQSRLRGTDVKERAQQKVRKSTPFIRKIPVTHQIEDVRTQMRKCPGIPLKDLTITQPIPNSEFTGKWKYMSCEGPTTALEMLTQTCEKRNLPWRINSAPPTRPTPFFDNQTQKPHRELAARPEGPPKPFTPQHRPISIPSLSHHHSASHYHPPPPPPSQFCTRPSTSPKTMHGSRVLPALRALTGLWHQLQAQERELAHLRHCLGAPPPQSMHWGQNNQ